MALFPAIFTPDSLSIVAIVSYYCPLVGFFRLINDCIHHGSSNLQTFFRISCQEHMERFFFLRLLVEQLLLKILNALLLRPSSSDLYFTFTLPLKVLLSLTTWSYYLPNIVDRIILRDKNLDAFLWRFVVRGRHICWIHSYHIRDQSVSFFLILVFEPQLPCVCSKPRLLIVNWRRRW